MTVTATSIEYRDGETLCRGEYFTPVDVSGPLPVVLVVHAWDGLVEEVRDKAAKLAAAGYIAFAIDVYGDGKTFTDMSQLEAVLTPFMSDRAMLLQRMQAALSTAATLPGGDPARIAAIGYCFGGLCALDLARGADPALRAVVSLHGGLAPSGLENTADISAAVLVLHGEDDPLVPPPQVAEFKAEMNSRNADWQLLAYGHTMHAFTRPGADMPEAGALYSASADRRSWQSTLSFLAEMD